jgi:anaerobic magnesium-protoporphyrin IX monomethyl ester cyclase
MAKGYRKKSPERCADEFEVLYRLGYREALLTDDIFTSDNNWAIAVCEAIKARGIKMAWTCTNGIRVDSANEALFKAMKEAGCYRVHFGFETGNDRVLKAFGKGGRATLEQGRIAVKQARAAGLETWGMFMVGLSADDEDSMADTIRYAQSIDVDVKKLGITVPFPGTPMFKDLHEQGRIKSYDWDDYNVYNEASAVFDHPKLSWETVRSYYKKAYLEIYYKSPRYIMRRLWRSLLSGDLFHDLYFGTRFFFMLKKKVEVSEKENYAFEHCWRPLTVLPKDLDQRDYQTSTSNSWKRAPKVQSA